eukprot:symbB.v1.2.012707.t1/scaffold882.1/size155402/2
MDTSNERNEDVQQSLVNYKAHLCEVTDLTLQPSPLDPDEEELYMQLLHVEAKADVRKSLVKLCEQCCVAVVSPEDNEIVDAIAQSVDGLLIQEAAIPLLTYFGWQRRDMEEQDDAAFTLWDPPEVAPVLNSFFHLTIQPPPPNPPGPSDPVWSVIISFDAELPFELVWGTQKMSKNATGTTGRDEGCLAIRGVGREERLHQRLQQMVGDWLARWRTRDVGSCAQGCGREW